MTEMLSLNLVTHGRARAAALACEQSVFLDAFGNTRELLEEQYGAYGPQSVFLTVSNAEGLVLGHCRLIAPGPAGLKTVNDLAEPPWSLDPVRVSRIAGIDPQRCWDIATLGVRREYRGRTWMIAIALYHGIIKAARINGIEMATAMVDEQIHRALQQVDYLPSTLPGARPAPYLGSPQTTPVFARFSAVLDGQRRRNPDAYRLMVLGVGLDGISVPEDSAFVLTPVAQPAAGIADDDRAVLLRAG